MKTEFITGYHNLWPFLVTQGADIDINVSGTLPRAWFGTSEGEEVACGSYQQMLQEMNDRFDTCFIPDMSTSSRNNYFNIAMEHLKGEDVVKAPEPVVEEVKPEVSSLISLQAAPAPEVVVEAPIEGVVEDEAPVADIDWDYINSLGSDKVAKDALESYCKQFGIDLKKNRSFANMLKDFKEFMKV